ncbi:ABC transporter substrate-binding protein [Ilumatobacter coccineus]|uniref:Putative oligopeptide ABC transporter oligopeptide-binding protein n=1 Tax=Ilumatobacter coccineus (strain NBRC 103263 / KCTC 29153 / YM16-304) TaxID=1313172 RepID=A0A6C7E9S7_ILUCY|nr:ABC transporter substrate-binding protein [Ilumatobacter coccineus]BAN01905.1 putative oligopeptide ABC transporter oligopeptide-binding protein [Ilumatobacter coccineus YM16-304]
MKSSLVRFWALSGSIGLVAAGCAGSDEAPTAEPVSTDVAAPTTEPSTTEPSTTDAPPETTSETSVAPEPEPEPESEPQPEPEIEPELQPVRGGTLTMLLDAETDTWDIPNSNCATSCMTIMKQVADPLLALDEDGALEPFLLESFDVDADFTEWTLTMRDGVVFHDGTPADGAALQRSLTEMANGAVQGQVYVKLLDGTNSIELVDDMTVRVTFREPTASYGHQLTEWTGWLLAPSFWDAPDKASAFPVSTGPFAMTEWTRGERTALAANDEYWRTDAAGEALPYLDEVIFRPVPDVSTRRTIMESGDADVNADSFPENLEFWETDWVDQGNGLAERSPDRDVEFLMFNSSAPPFDDVDVRRGLALCTDRDEYITFRAPGTARADGPFAPGSIGHLDDTGLPDFDAAAGTALFDEIGRPDLLVSVTNVPAQLLTAELFADQWSRNCGLDVGIDAFEQTEFITKALTADYQMLLFRNHGSGNPALETVWWHSRHAEGLATNFGRIIDPEMDRLMEALDATDDVDELDAIAQDVNRLFGAQVYNLWLNTGEWALPYRSGVHGVGEISLESGNTQRGAVGGRVWLHEAWIES